MPALPSNIAGKPVRRDDFFGREPDLRRVWERLETDHLLLSAPRRVGKTSLMFRLHDQAEARGWHAVYLSVEAAEDERHVLALLLAELARHPGLRGFQEVLQGRRWGDLWSRVSKVSAATLAVELRQQGPEGWQALAAALEEALMGHPPGKRLLVMIDELPVFLLRLAAADPVRARGFLSWFRDLRQGSVSRPDDPVRWLLAGSIGLAQVARRERWSALINDVQGMELGAYPPETAHRLLDALSQRYQLGFSEADRAQILDFVGWPIPYFLHLFVHRFRELEPGSRSLAAARAALLGPAARKDFSPWWERLTDELGPTDAAAARRLLSAVASDPAGARRDAVVLALESSFSEDQRDEKRAWLLDVLEGDGYIVWDGERWRFRSPLLRAFWLDRIQR